MDIAVPKRIRLMSRSAEKLELLLDSGREIKKNKDVFGAGGSLRAAPKTSTSLQAKDPRFSSSSPELWPVVKRMPWM